MLPATQIGGVSIAYVITNGKVYISTTYNNQCQTVNHLEDAKTFDSRVKAENYKKCIPNYLKNLKFFVADMAADIKVEPSALPSIAPSPPADTAVPSSGQEQENVPVPEEHPLSETLNLSLWQEEADRFHEFIQRSCGRKQAIYAKQLAAEDRIMDIEHAMEFYRLDARRGYQLYKLMHEARQERRRCKNALMMIDTLERATLDDFRSGKFSRCVAGIANRKYTPRALPELFAEEDVGVAGR